jgi:hypothetical protein
MVDAEGFVLGVVRLKLKEGDGIGFAIPVNSVKDFLEANGYGGLVPVDRLRLGGEEILEDKGLTLRLPESIEDVSPSRLRAFSEPSPNSVAFAADRVVTPWELARLEEALLSGEAFGAFRATGLRRSQMLSGGRLVLGSATGQDADGFEAKIEYAILGNGPEKVVLRYVGSAEAVAFNRSVLVESLSSAGVASLLSSPLEKPLVPDQLAWEPVELPSPSAPSVVFPRGWDQEASAPFPCPGLPPVESATAVSPPGDFRISLRAAWWGSGPDAASAARACSERAGRRGESSYGYSVDYLGVRYSVSGIFTEIERALLQLEVVAPADAAALVSELTGFWIETNLRSLHPP